VSKGRILLFGRDSKRLLWRADLLRRNGFTPFVSENLEQARKVCQEVPFDAAVIGHSVDATERTNGRQLSGIKADGYVPFEDEQRCLESLLEGIIARNSEQPSSESAS
jgi:hypothetical protein